MRTWILPFYLIFSGYLSAQAYLPVEEKPPQLSREFRAAWVATIYNIDWPSRTGLSSKSQKAEATAILDKLVSLKMNAVILQVRPHADALYASELEPWSPWLTGTMGKSPGYDPLTYWIEQGHARGIEIHAWFNPFRALSNTSHSCGGNHISLTKPHVIKKFGKMLWCDPAHPDTRTQALAVILDVVRRYDIDGVHLDDYFYPYPSGGITFPDGKSPAERRSVVDSFVSTLYSSVKSQKPWVRVGISPFGIWRPGTPSGIIAGVDSYEDLAADSQKWLQNGWVDYLAPQLYWRISPAKQSFPALLGWWRSQGSRPVWPGIATSRIQSSEDPGRPSAEVINQIDLSRKIGQNWIGHLHWSMKALMNNQGGIATALESVYTQPVSVPPMPWMSTSAPETPSAGAEAIGEKTKVHWENGSSPWKIAIQARYGSAWRTEAIVPANIKHCEIPRAEAIAVSALDRFGNVSTPIVFKSR